MRRLGATVAVAMLLALTVAGPAEAGRPAPAPDPYISHMAGTVRWVQNSWTSTWYYILDVTVTVVGLGMKPLYMPCTHVAFDGGEQVGLDQMTLQPASRPRVTVSSSVTMSAEIPAGSGFLTVTSQLMRLGNNGCCTNVGSLRAADATLPSPPPAHDTAITILDVAFPAP